MKFVFISDTHGRHNEIVLPEGDILVHTGDFSPRGEEADIAEFLAWFSEQPFTYKLCIAGNHDFLAENEPEKFMRLVPKNVIYLENEDVKLGGLKIWGSPVTPWFFDWAFNRQRGEEIAEYWEKIPSDTDVLLTHGPPFGILDKTKGLQRVGCEDLLRELERVRPKVHAFGHIHESYGVEERDGITFVNASNLDLRYILVNDPIVLDIVK